MGCNTATCLWQWQYSYPCTQTCALTIWTISPPPSIEVMMLMYICEYIYIQYCMWPYVCYHKCTNVDFIGLYVSFLSTGFLKVYMCEHWHAFTYVWVNVYVVVCTDLSGNEQHKQVSMGSMVTSRSVGGVMVSTWGRDARDAGLIPALGTIFHIFMTPTTLVPWLDSCTSYTLPGCWSYPVYVYAGYLSVWNCKH